MDNSVIKAEALSLAEEANKLCRSESLSDEKQGVELFVQAMMLGGEETDLSGGRKLTNNFNDIPYSDEFLGACQRLAIDALGRMAYEEAMQYCKYVRESEDYVLMIEEQEGEVSLLGTSMINQLIKEHMKKRPDNFDPERVCAEVEVVLYGLKDSPFYDLQKALYNRKRAAALCSIDSIKMLAEHYYETATCLEEAREACFYYGLLDIKNDLEFIAKKEAARNKYISMLAKNVTYTFRALKVWMRAVAADENMTWERYSGLTEELSEQLPRKPLDDAMYLNSKDPARTTIKSIGDYQPGVIDLDDLWKQFVKNPKNRRVDKQILFLKKMEYNECLYVGDFVDCCKYLWEQTYKNN